MEQNFNLYHIFYTVAKCRNISGAARELYISQPAISKAISKLEQSLGTTLFYRSSRGVSLTEPGEILFAQVENAFQAITQGEGQLQRFQKLQICPAPDPAALYPPKPAYPTLHRLSVLPRNDAGARTRHTRHRADRRRG